MEGPLDAKGNLVIPSPILLSSSEEEEEEDQTPPTGMPSIAP